MSQGVTILEPIDKFGNKQTIESLINESRQYKI